MPTLVYDDALGLELQDSTSEILSNLRRNESGVYSRGTGKSTALLLRAIELAVWGNQVDLCYPNTMLLDLHRSYLRNWLTRIPNLNAMYRNTVYARISFYNGIVPRGLDGYCLVDEPQLFDREVDPSQPRLVSVGS